MSSLRGKVKVPEGATEEASDEDPGSPGRPLRRSITKYKTQLQVGRAALPREALPRGSAAPFPLHMPSAPTGLWGLGALRKGARH